MIRAVIDTNVLVSVLLSKSEESSVIKLIDAVLDGKIIPLYNSEIVAEYTEVLSRPKFKFDREIRELLVERIVFLGEDADRTAYSESLPDEDDRVFYEVALSTEDAYLITGNLKHFPKTPIVVTPAQMLDILNL
ncbi:MAG: putative toxin-antitoxin system toxin component, PIN family [Bacteroidaceae bacterium]|nr:putative toxin-antitoxin system toxin component, PIN family [Bacteroidaceae bacterium]